MKCKLCNGKLSNKRGPVEFFSKIAGTITIPNIKYEECLNCHDRIYSTSEYEKIIDYVENKEQYLINQQPMSSFVSAREAAKILGMTKQAFSKNSRIKRGFILYTKIDGRKYYLKKSVKKYKENNHDGRFLIDIQKPKDKWYSIGEVQPVFGIVMIPDHSNLYQKIESDVISSNPFEHLKGKSIINYQGEYYGN